MVDAAVQMPIVLYNIPGNALNAITPELAVRLAELEHVVAIKESSGDWNNFYSTLLGVRDELRVFCGPSSSTRRRGCRPLSHGSGALPCAS